MRTGSNTTRLVAAATAIYVGAFAMAGLSAQKVTRPMVPPTPLSKLAPPVQPPNIGEFILDNQAAIALGKALFWDMQASSDNLLACASCHFHAGADNRTKNQISPDLKNAVAALSTVFDPMATANKGGPNYELRVGDFPFHQLSDPNDRNSVVLHESDDVVSSQGVFASDFGKLTNSFFFAEKNTLTPDGVFMVGPAETRRVEPRNTPTVINAALNYRNFWDGRANAVFNGVTPFGPHDKGARVWVVDPENPNKAVQAVVRILYASAASQAVGPALSGFEMSAANRTFADLGHKMLTTKPLLYQTVADSDSVLGALCCNVGPFPAFNVHIGTGGLKVTYESLIKQAFHSDYWSVPDAAFQQASGMPYRQIEANFSLFWGLAIQAYEQTLISDDAPFDRFVSGKADALTPQQKNGLAIFSGDRGRCVNCHKGAEFTGASTRMVIGSFSDGFAGDGPIENMLMGDRQSALYDNGFYNIGVVAPANDLGVGATDPWDNPLSFTRQLKNSMIGGAAPDAMTHSLTPCDFQSLSGCTVVYDPRFRDAVDGSFKAPSLRNVELTGPYFHTGGYATLEQVVDFYSRGGNVRGANGVDTSGFGANRSNYDLDVLPLGLTATERAALVAFLKSLTDDRVRYERAPFDHPGLTLLPNGHPGDNNAVTSSGTPPRAKDNFTSIPAVGAAGLSSPMQPFTPKP